MNNYLYYSGNPEITCSEIAPVGVKYYCEAWLEFKLKNPEKGANFLKKKGRSNWMQAAIDNYSLPEDPETTAISYKFSKTLISSQRILPTI